MNHSALSFFRASIYGGLCAWVGFVLGGCGTQPSVAVTTDARLTAIRLATLQATTLPTFPISDDHGVLLGAIGSDLFHDPADPADTVWAVTDRGPNRAVKRHGDERMTALVPE